MSKTTRLAVVIAAVGDMAAVARTQCAIWFLLIVLAGIAIVVLVLTAIATFKRNGEAFTRIERLIRALRA
jgi:hypothetical protein